MLPSFLTEDTGCWPDSLRARSLFTEDRALHQSLAHQHTLLRQDSSDVSLPTGAHTSSPGPLPPPVQPLQVPKLVPPNCSALPFLPPSPCWSSSPSMPSPCSPTCSSPTWPTYTRRSLDLSLLYLFLSLLITLGSPVPPGKQGAPPKLAAPPLSSRSSTGWDPRGLTCCAVSALGPSNVLSTCFPRCLISPPRKALPPSHQLWPGPSSSPQASCL